MPSRRRGPTPTAQQADCARWASSACAEARPWRLTHGFPRAARPQFALRAGRAGAAPGARATPAASAACGGAVAAPGAGALAFVRRRARCEPREAASRDDEREDACTRDCCGASYHSCTRVCLFTSCFWAQPRRSRFGAPAPAPAGLCAPPAPPGWAASSLRNQPGEREAKRSACESARAHMR